MGFRDLFKVRQPGYGEKFEKRVSNVIAQSKKRSFPSEDNSQNSGGKKAVK